VDVGVKGGQTNIRQDVLREVVKADLVDDDDDDDDDDGIFLT